MSKDYEIYNDYHRWIKQGDKVDKYAYDRCMEHKSFEEKLLKEITNNYAIKQSEINKY